MKLRRAASLLLSLVIAAATGAAAAPQTGDYFHLTVKNRRRPVLALRIGTGPKRTYRSCDGTRIPLTMISNEEWSESPCPGQKNKGGGVLAFIPVFRPHPLGAAAFSAPPPVDLATAAPRSDERAGDGPTATPIPTPIPTPNPTAMPTQPPLTVDSRQRLFIGATEIPMNSCPPLPGASCLIARHARASDQRPVFKPSEVQLVAYNEWGDSTWSFSQLLANLHASATFDGNGLSTTIDIESRRVRQPLSHLEGYGYMFPIVAGLGRLGANVSMTSDRAVIAY